MVFRDSRGVVHTVAAADPLDDLSRAAADALRSAVLRTDEADVGTALERCDALQELLAQWQQLFFAALPADVDLAEERTWAARAGLSLDEVEAGFEEDDAEADEPEEDPDPFSAPEDDDPRALLPEDLVAVLERELLLLPVRTRLEALVAAETLVITWTELLADQEKLLGHLVLAHAAQPAAQDHEALARQHAHLHETTGAGHPGRP